MFSLNWIIVLERTWISLGILLVTVLTTAHSSCPKDVSTKAHSCFTAYSFHFQNMQHSPQKLCCGVDVETLRAFCHSYMSATECVKHLKAECPQSSHQIIDKALVNLDGARAGLLELCSDDSIIESYAMYQSCFTLAGGGSERCFQTHMSNNTGMNIRFLSKVSTNRKDQFCNDMRATISCVQRNVKAVCGEEAARMAAILVKPMVRQSTECDYSVINNRKTTKSPYPGHHAYISDEHAGGNSRSGKSSNKGRNSACPVRNVSLTTVSTSLFLVSVFHMLYAL